MNVIVDIQNIIGNIKNARCITNVPISLMFKEFYEDILNCISVNMDLTNTKVFATKTPSTINYRIGMAESSQSATIVTSEDDFDKYSKCGFNDFYIPINANDDREGLCVQRAKELNLYIRKSSKCKSNVSIMITSGCLNENHPTFEQMDDIWNEMIGVQGISLGGSFWLGKGSLPSYITDLRIGEYMLFGTIPYNDNTSLLGYNGIKIETNVISVYPDRKEIIVDCGYSYSDMDKCRCIDDYGIEYVDSSSEYTIYRVRNTDDFPIGRKLYFVPNYKSLVKLRNANRRFVNSEKYI